MLMVGMRAFTPLHAYTCVHGYHCIKRLQS